MVISVLAMHLGSDTAAKLQEEQKWLAEEKLREAIEKRDDVVKRGHMGDFYRSACTLNFRTSELQTTCCLW